MITFDDCVEIHETIEMEKWRERELQGIYEEAIEVAHIDKDEDGDSRMCFYHRIFEDYLEKQSLTENEIQILLDWKDRDGRFEA